MSHRVLHKESLPGQGHIKRRRGPIARPETGESAESDEKAKEKETVLGSDAESEDSRHETKTSRASIKKARREEGDAPPSSSSSGGSSSSSSSSEEDDDDADAIAQEKARLAELHERTTASASRSAGLSSSSAAAAAAKASGSYNYDVPFRRQDWRKSSANVSSSGKAEEKERKWRMVVNNKEESSNYQLFLKKHFK